MEETRKLVSAGDCIQIWNLLVFSPEANFNPHASEQEVSSLCWSSNIKHQFLVSAASGGDKISMSICKTKPICLGSLAEQRGQTCVSWNSTSNLILSGGTDCAVNLWDLKTSKLHKSYKGHKDIVTCLTNDWDDQHILSGSQSGEIILHSTLTDQIPATFCSRSQQPIRDLQLSYFQRSLLGSVGDDGTVALWDLNTLQLQHSFESVHKAPASALCFSPMIESVIITVGLDKRISTFDVRSKSLLHSIRTDSPLTAIELLPDGTTLVIGSSRGTVSLYDFRNMEFPVKSSKAHSGAVRCIKLQTERVKLQARYHPENKCSPETPCCGRELVWRPGPCGLTSKTTYLSTNTYNIEAAWPTAWSNVKGGDANVSVAANTSNKDVSTSSLSDPPALQVRSVAPSKPFARLGKVIFLAKNYFGEMFSPIRSDLNCTNISTTNEFTSTPDSCASNCSPRAKSGPCVEKLANLPMLAVGPETKTPVLFNEETCLTAEKSNQVQNLHNYNSKQETIEQKPYPKTVVDTLSHPSVQPDKEGTVKQAASLVDAQLLQNILKDALEEFSEAHHREVVGLKLAMIREFQIQQIAIGEAILKHFAVREELLEEFLTLNEENERLKMFR